MNAVSLINKTNVSLPRLNKKGFQTEMRQGLHNQTAFVNEVRRGSISFCIPLFTVLVSVRFSFRPESSCSKWLRLQSLLPSVLVLLWSLSTMRLHFCPPLPPPPSLYTSDASLSRFKSLFLTLDLPSTSRLSSLLQLVRDSACTFSKPRTMLRRGLSTLYA